jgi:hypothetical protein
MNLIPAYALFAIGILNTILVSSMVSLSRPQADSNRALYYYTSVVVYQNLPLRPSTSLMLSDYFSGHQILLAMPNYPDPTFPVIPNRKETNRAKVESNGIGYRRVMHMQSDWRRRTKRMKMTLRRTPEMGLDTSKELDL